MLSKKNTEMEYISTYHGQVHCHFYSCPKTALRAAMNRLALNFVFDERGELNEAQQFLKSLDDEQAFSVLVAEHDGKRWYEFLADGYWCNLDAALNVDDWYQEEWLVDLS